MTAKGRWHLCKRRTPHGVRELKLQYLAESPDHVEVASLTGCVS